MIKIRKGYEDVTGMKKTKLFLNEKHTKTAAKFLNIFCYLAMAVFVMCLVLAFMGRQSFALHTSTGDYERATYAESTQDVPSYGTSTGLTVGSTDHIRVMADEHDRIGLATHIALSLMYAVTVLPAMLGFWFLSRVFSNVSNGEFFIEQNARLILYYGLIRIFSAFLVPPIKMLICIFNTRISLSVNNNLPDYIFQGIAFLVAAYIIHYGINLQDEVDHTI